VKKLKIERIKCVMCPRENKYVPVLECDLCKSMDLIDAREFVFCKFKSLDDLKGCKDDNQKS
jgi:hypothetical protein